MKIPFKWEEISTVEWRAKVIGGWLYNDTDCNSMVFIPDPNHEWEIAEE